MRTWCENQTEHQRKDQTESSGKIPAFQFWLAGVSILFVLGCKSTGSTGELERKPSAEAPAAAVIGVFKSFPQDPGFIQNMKQITFVGPRSGEGYFSADGKKMIFQSERNEGNPFYQIYLMDLESGATQRLSPGQGKTTCAWLHPSGKKALFSSTHLDPQTAKLTQEEIESRKQPQKGKYSWSFDDNFDLFETDLKGKNLKRLTKEKGYDAEGNYSPDGKKIVFASNRAAYTDVLTEEDKKYFAQDPSYMMDIYIMNSDGSQVRRLTSTRGYDGGPFFSADGSKITWRRFSANGQIAEAYVMNIDGTGEKQVTKLKAMSWAPFFHPSGDYLIYTSNVLGFSNFELFIVDTKGERDPVRVSYLDGFDGLPVFTPDGKKLSWTRRNEKGESQIYLADWDDQKAREILGLSAPSPDIKKMSSKEISPVDAKTWVSYLAAPEMAGRATGSAEEKIYTAKIAQAFKDLGLVPAEGKSFLVPFTFTSGVELGTGNQLTLKLKSETAPTTKVSEDFVPLSFSQVGAFPEAPVVFAGYGITAPASPSQPAYDSYKNLDVKGKWVLVFRDIPEEIPNEKRIHLNLYSRLQNKALVAKNQGAVGVLVVNGPNSASKKLIQLRYEGGFAQAGIPLLHISNSLAEALLKSSGKSLKTWQDGNDKGEIATGEIPGALIQAQIDLKFRQSQGLNVIGKLAVPGAKSSVMFGGHGDHLGRGEHGNSLARNEEQGVIHYGADDNASGVAGTLEIAKDLSLKVRAGKLKLKQNLLFAVWSGEEIGLLGSTHYLQDRKGEKISAYLNMDMIGRLRLEEGKPLQIQAVASAKEWKSLIEQAALKTQLSFSLQDDPYVPSDSMAFHLKSIPSLMFFTGAHAEYHSPRDKIATINFQGLALVAQFIKNLGLQLAQDQDHLTYQKAESSQRKLEGRSFRIYLGTIPDYTQEGIMGVKISGTTKDSPAEKAGLIAGDVITELASIKIQNLYDYVYCLQGMKANVETKVLITRQGKPMELKIMPSLKE